MGIDQLNDWVGEAWSSEPPADEHSKTQGFELYA
jgi:hypothetical protein